MKRIKTAATHILLAAFLGGMPVSCVNDALEDNARNKTEEESDGEGLISFALLANPMNRTKTRSAVEDETTYLNFEEENRVKEIRVILYDMTGKARYIKDLDTENPSDWVGDQLPTFPTYQTKAFEVERRKYQIAVLVNYKNEWRHYASDRDREATDIEYRTRNLGHDKKVLTETPLDFSKNAGQAQAQDWLSDDMITVNNYKARTFVMQTLAGGTNSPASELYPVWDDVHFFMSNADGLVDIIPDDLKESEALAENYPIEVRVERALAKVAFLCSRELKYPLNITMPGGGSEMRSDGGSSGGDPQGAWGIDAYNLRVYPIRQQAPIAPYPYGNGVGLSMETASTDRRDRYAIDPNYSSQPASHFFLAPSVYQNPIYAQDELNGYGEWDYIPSLSNELTMSNNPTKEGTINTDDPWTYTYLEYVPENTMTPEDYHLGNTTHILLALQMYYKFWEYARYERMSVDDNTTRIGGENMYEYIADDYVVFNDKVYPFIMVYDCWLHGYSYNDNMYDYITGELITLDDFENAGFTAAQKQDINDLLYEGWSGEVHGVKYYSGGMNFYRVPIRHFVNEQSPVLNTGYGRYGVVRNNTYLLTLESIKGLGHYTVPPPGPITEEETQYLSISTTVYPWLYHWQDTELGEGGSTGE